MNGEIYNHKSLEAGLAEYEEAQRVQADMPSAHLNLGVLRASMGDRDLAERSYRKALELDPSMAAALSALAQIHYSRESFDESLAAAERLLELDPDSCPVPTPLDDEEFRTFIRAMGE
mgnify:CR=1 FL=1